MIEEKKFCKGCGQKIMVFYNPFSPKQYVELDNGYYCLECAKVQVKKRREKLK